MLSALERSHGVMTGVPNEEPRLTDAALDLAAWQGDSRTPPGCGMGGVEGTPRGDGSGRLLPGTRLYRGTSPLRNRAPLEPYRRTMPRALWWSQRGRFLMKKVTLYMERNAFSLSSTS